MRIKFFKYEKLEAVDDESEKIKRFSILSIISWTKNPHSVLVNKLDCTRKCGNLSNFREYAN
jgi:hypothetical protein